MPPRGAASLKRTAAAPFQSQEAMLPYRNRRIWSGDSVAGSLKTAFFLAFLTISLALPLRSGYSVRRASEETFAEGAIFPQPTSSNHNTEEENPTRWQNQ
jgi:hypothetical protein